MFDKSKISEQNRLFQSNNENENVDSTLPDWQKKELDRRIEKEAKNPSKGIEWKEAIRKIRSNIK